MTSRVVVAPNWIGDAVMSIPVLRAMRRAGGRLVVLAPRGPATIYRAEASAELVLTRSGLFADASALRRERFDEAWLLPNSFRSSVSPFLAGIPKRIGYPTDRRRWLLTDAITEPPRTAHQLRDYDALLLSRDIPPDRDPPRLPVPPAGARRAAAVLEAAGVTAPPILLAPASASLPAKRWPPERWAELARRLASAGTSCALVVGPGELDLASDVRRRSGSDVPVLGADLDPVELAALLARSYAVVANDSGPMHLAAAVGAPVVGLFGPTDPARTGPLGEKTRVVKRSSMEEIAVEEVWEAVFALSSLR